MASRLRVTILSDSIPPESPGGAGRVAWLLATGLRDAGHDVHVIAGTDGASEQGEQEGIPVHTLHADPPDRWRAYLSLANPRITGPLKALLQAIRPDVLNAHNVHERMSYHCLALADWLGIPVVLTAHDTMAFSYTKLAHFVNAARCAYDPVEYRLPPAHSLRQMRLRYNPLRNVIIRRVLRRHTRVRVAVSEALRQALEANGLPAYRVVHNGLRPGSFDAPAAAVLALRQRLGLEGRRVVLFGGRMSHEKGAGQVLAALDTLVRRVPQAALLVLSRRPLDEALLASYPGLGEVHVRHGGWLAGEDLAAAYQMAEVVTVPSIYLDPFPTIVLEAMAAGRPAVVTCLGGAPEAVVDGQTGYVINPFDAAMFADRLERLLSDDSLRAQMGHAARRRLETAFTLEQQASQMATIYTEAITAQRRS